MLGGGALLFCAGLAGGINYLRYGQYIQSTDDAYVGGNISALTSQVSGLVTEVAVTDNEAVHKGQLLIQLDDRPYRAALAKAQADVQATKAAKANLIAQATLQDALVDEARAKIASADAALPLATANRTRYDNLARINAASKQQAQAAGTAYTQAVAAAQRAHAALKAAQAKLTVIQSEQAEAQANLDAAEAQARISALNLQYTQIRAPFDGTVGDRAAHVGDYAKAGAPLLSLVPANGLWVDANFKEDQLAHMHPGQTVRISADISPDTRITGTVQSLAPASGAVFSILPAENATGNFTKIVQRVPVRILLNGDAGNLGLLRPGLSVTASVNTK
ncbi:membrane fusion protein, multidrug efflux system [Acidocella aminolytica 101 = DSM 11237]|jgi:membrane fusion protein (multidrug efflux system)|nr:membrane fusion protein, multidrug efflux system [Acidocella aminolytica 101 = DSM 11237]